MRIYIFISLILTFAALQLSPPSHAVDNNEWQNHPSGSEAALSYGSKYVEKHRHNINKVDSLAKHLHIEGRFLEVVNLYENARKYHPKNRELLYKLNLAKSDLHESISLNTFNHQQHKIFSNINLAKLNKIKCQSLRNEEGSKACKRIGIEKKKQILASNTHIEKNYENFEKPIVNSRELVTENTQTKNNRNTFSDVQVGDFHALIIGNNNYPNFPKLETAVSDAKAVADILKNNYGFKVTKLENANRYEIFQKLSNLRKQLNENDNLLIYYAGHGYLDEDTQRGYWLPVDAEEHNYANWLSTNDITDMLNGMSAKRVLVVADSCYSGTLTRNIRTSSDSIEASELKWLQRITKKRSRTVMTSGGLEPVLDSGGANHSVFTQAFINALIENESILDASRMFSTVRRSVLLNADQTPEYADIRKAGHEGGDFIFIRVN